jgi:TatD DNase family protein
VTGGDSPSAFVDAHCHVDLFPQPQRIVQQAEAHCIYTIAVTNAPSVFAHTAGLAAGSKYIRPSIGLHPELVPSHRHELDQFRSHLAHTRYVGEVGLDYTTTDRDVRLLQRQVLTSIADWVSAAGDKVVTLHSRRAASDVMAVLKGVKARMILHWFSGTYKELDQAIAEGYFFSVNGAMMQSTKGRALVARMPKGRILTETDGPFTRDGTSPATPISVKLTVTLLAELLGLPPRDLQAQVIENFRNVLVCPP